MDKSAEPFRLNDITVFPDRGRIRGPQGEQRLPARLMRLLCMLVQAEGSTISREALVAELWPRGYVNEEALSRAVADLRRVLDDDARQPRYIETIPKQGYRMRCLATPLPTAPLRKARRRWPLALAGALSALLTLVLIYQKFGNSTHPNSAPLASAARMTADSTLKLHPQISPDGRWLAFARIEDGQSLLSLLSTQGGMAVRTLAVPGNAWSPVFDPTSSKLAVAVSNEQDCHLYEVVIASGESRPLGPCMLTGAPGIIDWSDDGDWLAYSDRDPQSGAAAIWRMRLSNGERVQLTAPPGPYIYDTRPRFSPDGSKLSFSRGTRAVRDIWVADFEDPATGRISQTRQLSFDRQFTTGHDWLPQGNLLILDSERTGYRALWTLDLEGEWQLLGARDAESPTLGGGSVAFKVSQYESNIWLLDTASGESGEQPLISSTKYDSNPAWSPDGSEIAFTSNRSGRGAIWLAYADGSRQRLLYEPEDGRVMWPSWSPDGSFLIATRYDSSGQYIVRIALNRREVRVVPAAGEHPYGGTYSADGAWLYYVSSGTGEGTRLWRQRADGDGDDARQVSRSSINSFRLISDQWLVYTKHGQDGLFRAPLDESGNETPLVADFPASFWVDWTARGDWIYFRRLGPDGSSSLARLSVESGEIETVSELHPTALGPNLAVGPGGRQILIARNDRMQTDLFLARLTK